MNASRATAWVKTKSFLHFTFWLITFKWIELQTRTISQNNCLNVLDLQFPWNFSLKWLEVGLNWQFMSFDNFDFSSLAPNSKRNQIYSCLGFSMGFLLKKTFNTYDIFISNFFNNFLVSHNLLTPLRPYPTVLGGLPPKKLGVHVHPVHPQFHHPC